MDGKPGMKGMPDGREQMEVQSKVELVKRDPGNVNNFRYLYMREAGHDKASQVHSQSTMLPTKQKTIHSFEFKAVRVVGEHI